MITRQEIEEKIEKLRQEWQEDPAKRPIIERRAKFLKIALEINAKRHPNQQPMTLTYKAEVPPYRHE